jgi:hypothetical protein
MLGLSRPQEVSMRQLAIAIAITLALGVGGLVAPRAARADVPDWNAIAEIQTVQVSTVDEDDEPRDTTVWLVVVDGQGYIRTGSTTWGANVQRNPEIDLEIGDRAYAVRAEFVEDDALREKVEAAFREKYGWSDWLLAALRGNRPKIMRLLPR